MDKIKTLIKEWQERQREYEEKAQMWEFDEHNYKKFTYKAMATRDCWKELLKVVFEDKMEEHIKRWRDKGFAPDIKTFEVSLEQRLEEIYKRLQTKKAP